MAANHSGPTTVETIGSDFYDDPHSYYRRWRERGIAHRVRFPDNIVRRMCEARAKRKSPVRTATELPQRVFALST
ncbi:hypothetical protein ACWEF9_39000, partial [Streptomyces sp. NPDC004980]